MDTGSVAALVQVGSFIKQGLAIVAATFCIYFGFRLFYLTERRTGDFEASSKWGRVRLSNAAPGIFFTLFGCIVLTVTLLKENSVVASADGAAAAPRQGTILASRGALAGGSGPFDATACARATSFAATDIRSRSDYVQAEPQRKVFLDSKIEVLEQLTAHCVDQALGPGAYARYARAERLMTAGSAQDAPQQDLEMHGRVSDLLGE